MGPLAEPINGCAIHKGRVLTYTIPNAIRGKLKICIKRRSDVKSATQFKLIYSSETRGNVQ